MSGYSYRGFGVDSPHRASIRSTSSFPGASGSVSSFHDNLRASPRGTVPQTNSRGNVLLSRFRQCTTFVWNICCRQTTSSPSPRESMTWNQEPQTCSGFADRQLLSSLLLPHSTYASICELYSWLQEPFMLFNPLNSKIWF